MSRISIALVAAIVLSPPALAEDMRIVCETRTGMYQRLDITLPDRGEPLVATGVGDDQASFTEHPKVLSHEIVGFRGNGPHDWLSTIHIQSQVKDETGIVRQFPPQTYFVDWRRAKVWHNFFSLMDEPNTVEIVNCVRVN